MAKVWGLPPALQACMRKPVGEAPARELQDAGERMRWLAHAADQVAGLLPHSQPQQAAERMAALARHDARALGVEPPQFAAATEIARQRLTGMARR